MLTATAQPSSKPHSTNRAHVTFLSKHCHRERKWILLITINTAAEFNTTPGLLAWVWLQIHTRTQGYLNMTYWYNHLQAHICHICISALCISKPLYGWLIFNDYCTDSWIKLLKSCSMRMEFNILHNAFISSPSLNNRTKNTFVKNTKSICTCIHLQVMLFFLPRAAIKICTSRWQLYPCANTHTHTHISVLLMVGTQSQCFYLCDFCNRHLTHQCTAGHEGGWVVTHFNLLSTLTELSLSSATINAKPRYAGSALGTQT